MTTVHEWHGIINVGNIDDKKLENTYSIGWACTAANDIVVL